MFSRSVWAVEPLEPRRLLAVVRPDHIVVVWEQDRASDAITNPVMPYFTSLAASGLYYSNSHGVTHPSEPDTVAFYSGSTQGITDNGRGYSFGGANLAQSLFNAGLSFSGFVEDLPADGSQVQQAGTTQYPDLYTRNVNANAQFTNIGGARPNSAVNRTFAAFSAIPTTDYSSLPTVSLIIPDNLHSTHGSNLAYPWAGSPDVTNNQLLRQMADTWLHDNLDPYLQWAKTNNSLLIVTQDEEWWTGGTASTVTTIVNGDPHQFRTGVNSTYINHFNVLRTIEEMYNLPLLNSSATTAALPTDSQGLLAPDMAATSTALVANVASPVFGQPITFTATVSPAAGGTVTFSDGASVLGAVPLDASGTATFTTSTLAVGSHSITAAYGGSASYNSSTSVALSRTVSPAATAIALSSSSASVNAGQSITFTASVSAIAPGSGVPAGSVTFKDGSTVLATATLNAGAATFTTSTLSAGSHSITASYAASTNYSASASSPLTQIIRQAVSAIVLIDCDTQLPVAGVTLIPGGSNTLDLAKLPLHISMRADTNPAVVGSVIFGYDNNTKQRIENGAPYFLNGDYIPFNFAIGTHSVTATPYTATAGNGTVGAAMSITFSVIRSTTTLATASLTTTKTSTSTTRHAIDNI